MSRHRVQRGRATLRQVEERALREPERVAVADVNEVGRARASA